MNGNTVYWVWLSMALGAAARVDEILGSFSTPKEIYESGTTDKIISGVFSKKQIEKLEATPIKNAYAAIEICKKNGWKIYTLEDSAYPDMLRHLPDRPLVLYVDGDISYLNSSVAIGVVGTRKPSYESVEIAHRICAGMSAMNAVIVSGGALGIDSAAHEGALQSGGKTICVMGCGLGCGYLRENENLRRRISKSGALVTEYPPLMGVTRYSFPERNRIISGMSMGVLVVEAGEKSGSLITARNANEQGRDVFAIPGSILSSAYTGVNRLIRDGAMVVTCAQDILYGYSMVYPERINLGVKIPEMTSDDFSRQIKLTFVGEKEETKVIKIKKESSSGLDPDSAAVYEVFKNEPLHADEICAMTGIPAPRVLSALMILEMNNLIEATEGKCYQIV
ncbi:MAG: DNA-processing protein DprA [Clostridia bacterium]|nr:DNA-processing protein DprA [Clostridia bacterium]